ncbi:uncharacterized protein LOC110854119 [Folsomia candida]|uniref:Neuroparsin-A n=1 Tax=Folsomia candida TaxID=158441 RepID=A0A226DYS0_FOLCA|nr:uncharacterized protein LOC110854119 [Folsomia candida]OXA49944.1 Neuroparsin-A [Folsomia candida]
MHLLRLGGLRMRRTSGGVVGGTGVFTSSPASAFSDQQQALRAVDGVNLAKKSKTSTSFSLTHSANKIFIYVVAMVVLIFAFSSYADKYGVSAMPRCAPCPGGECPEPPAGTCTYGVVTNFCGRRICAKGPGEVCGTGMFKMLGACGDGMTCSCGRCIGCYINTMECFDKTCTK